MSVDRNHPVYPIGVVQRLTGLTGRQIRYYEQQGLLAPHRNEGNRRLYAPADVDRLLQIKDLLEQGMTLASIREWFRNREKEAEGTAAKAHAANPPPEEAGKSRAGKGPAETGKEDAATAAPSRTLWVDYERLVRELNRPPQLTSLYPVNDQAALQRLLELVHRRKDENASESRQ